MELRHLQYFLAIANEGSISKASKVLHITQPTLSRQIKELEDEIGKPLLIRGNRHITLTQEGIFLKNRAEEILNLFNKTTSELMVQDYEIEGEIYIGAGETIGFSIIGKAIHLLQKIHPKIKVNIYSCDYDDILDRLEKGLIDFGLLVTNSMLTEKYKHIILPYKDEAGILLRKDDPLSNKEYITRNELRHMPIFISRQPTSINMLKNWARLQDDELNVIGTYNLLYNASILVNEKAGYAFALNHLIDVSETSQLCFRPFYPQLSANLILIWKDYLTFSKPAQAFIKVLKEVIENYEID